MLLRLLVRIVGAVLFWHRYEGMSLTPFPVDEDDLSRSRDEVVRCDGGGAA